MDKEGTTHVIPLDEWEKKHPDTYKARPKTQAVPMPEMQRSEPGARSLMQRLTSLATSILALIHPVGTVAGPASVDIASKVAGTGQAAITDTVERVGGLANSAKERLNTQFPVPDAKAIELAERAKRIKGIMHKENQINADVLSRGGQPEYGPEAGKHR